MLFFFEEVEVEKNTFDFGSLPSTYSSFAASDSLPRFESSQLRTKTSHHYGVPRLHRGGCDCPGRSGKMMSFFLSMDGASMATVVVAEVC